jgi:hypothetical protein
MMEVRGTMKVMVQVAFRRPREDEQHTTWHKLVQVHCATGVTLEQAQACLARWKEVNPEAIGQFSCGLY